MANVIYQLVDCLSFRCGVITIEHRFDFTFEFPLALVGDPTGRRNCAAHSRCCPFILNRILSDEPPFRIGFVVDNTPATEAQPTLTGDRQRAKGGT
jgi:hypothetical protein